MKFNHWRLSKFWSVKLELSVWAFVINIHREQFKNEVFIFLNLNQINSNQICHKSIVQCLMFFFSLDSKESPDTWMIITYTFRYSLFFSFWLRLHNTDKHIIFFCIILRQPYKHLKLYILSIKFGDDKTENLVV